MDAWADNEVAQLANEVQVVWARVKGYPWWPAQVLPGKEAKQRLDLAVQRKDYTIPVMFFGTCEVAWLHTNDVQVWKQGVENGHHSKGQKQKRFALALTQVCNFLAGSGARQSPEKWWCLPPVKVTAPPTSKQPAALDCKEKQLAPVPRKKTLARAAAAEAVCVTVVAEPKPEKELPPPLPAPPARESTPQPAAAASGSKHAPSKYRLLRRNEWVSCERPNRKHKDDVHVCDCAEAPIEPGTGPACCGEDCLNRTMRILCDDKTCPAGKVCTNLPFCSQPAPKIEVFDTGSRGFGIRAMEPIKKGQFIIEYVGEVIDVKEMIRRLEAAREKNEMSFYIMELPTSRGSAHNFTSQLYIDARHKGNMARFINSCCDPNCETQKWTSAANDESHIGIFALKDLAAGEELTYDYQFEHYGAPDQSHGFVCMCGAANCRGTMDANPERFKDFGRRVDVYWDGDRVYYRGTIMGYTPSTRKHHIMYDDNTFECFELEKTKYRWLDEDAPEVSTGITNSSNNGSAAAGCGSVTAAALATGAAAEPTPSKPKHPATAALCEAVVPRRLPPASKAVAVKREKNQQAPSSEVEQQQDTEAGVKFEEEPAGNLSQQPKPEEQEAAAAVLALGPGIVAAVEAGQPAAVLRPPSARRPRKPVRKAAPLAAATLEAPPALQAEATLSTPRSKRKCMSLSSPSQPDKHVASGEEAWAGSAHKHRRWEELAAEDMSASARQRKTVSLSSPAAPAGDEAPGGSGRSQRKTMLLTSPARSSGEEVPGSSSASRHRKMVSLSLPASGLSAAGTPDGAEQGAGRMRRLATLASPLAPPGSVHEEHMEPAAEASVREGSATRALCLRARQLAAEAAYPPQQLADHATDQDTPQAPCDDSTIAGDAQQQPSVGSSLARPESSCSPPQAPCGLPLFVPSPPKPASPLHTSPHADAITSTGPQELHTVSEPAPVPVGLQGKRVRRPPQPADANVPSTRPPKAALPKPRRRLPPTYYKFLDRIPSLDACGPSAAEAIRGARSPSSHNGKRRRLVFTDREVLGALENGCIYTMRRGMATFLSCPLFKAAERSTSGSEGKWRRLREAAAPDLACTETACWDDSEGEAERRPQEQGQYGDGSAARVGLARPASSFRRRGSAMRRPHSHSHPKRHHAPSCRRMPPRAVPSEAAATADRSHIAHRPQEQSAATHHEAAADSNIMADDNGHDRHQQRLHHQSGAAVQHHRHLSPKDMAMRHMDRIAGAHHAAAAVQWDAAKLDATRKVWQSRLAAAAAEPALAAVGWGEAPSMLGRHSARHEVDTAFARAAGKGAQHEDTTMPDMVLQPAGSSSSVSTAFHPLHPTDRADSVTAPPPDRLRPPHHHQQAAGRATGGPTSATGLATYQGHPAQAAPIAQHSQHTTQHTQHTIQRPVAVRAVPHMWPAGYPALPYLSAAAPQQQQQHPQETLAPLP